MDSSLLNLGVIEHNPRPGDDGADGPRTILISGLGRSGTSMIAAVLQAAGLHIGTHLAAAVYEDLEMLDVFEHRDMDRLANSIAARNAAYGTWGFKLPNLHHFVRHQDIGMFRNPRLIIVLRDVVAVAVRHAIAEHSDAFTELADIADGIGGLLHFARLTKCPGLMVSYEKALAFPDDILDRLVGFCGLAIDDAMRARLRERISPNNSDYAHRARRVYEGVIERLDEYGRVIGWCRDTASMLPVQLEMLADGQPLCRFLACRPRPDLVAAGHGNGLHGFAQPLAPEIPPDAALRVRVAGTTWELPGSGRSPAELGRR